MTPPCGFRGSERRKLAQWRRLEPHLSLQALAFLPMCPFLPKRIWSLSDHAAVGFSGLTAGPASELVSLLIWFVALIRGFASPHLSRKTLSPKP